MTINLPAIDWGRGVAHGRPRRRGFSGKLRLRGSILNLMFITRQIARRAFSAYEEIRERSKSQDLEAISHGIRFIARIHDFKRLYFCDLLLTSMVAVPGLPLKL
jgi:hypothetical protein